MLLKIFPSPILCQKTRYYACDLLFAFRRHGSLFDAVAKRLFLALAEEDRTLIRNMDLTDELYRATFLALFEHILSYRSFYQVYVTKVAQLPFLSAVSAFGHSDGMKRYAAIKGITSKRQASRILRSLLLYRTDCHDPHVVGRWLARIAG